MATEKVAVQGCTFKHGTGSQGTGGVFTATTVPTGEKAGNKITGTKAIHRKEIQGILTGSTQGNCVQNAPANFKIEPDSGRKVKVDGEKVIHKGDDSQQFTVNGTDATQGGASCSYQCVAEVDDPGQDDVKTN
jgi:hypothetical protein